MYLFGDILSINIRWARVFLSAFESLLKTSFLFFKSVSGISDKHAVFKLTERSDGLMKHHTFGNEH